MTDLEGVKRNIGLNIKKQRKKAGLTQKGLGAGMKKSRFWLTAIEGGANFPTIDGLYKIADTLNCSIFDLLPVNSAGSKTPTVTGSGAEIGPEGQKEVLGLLEEVRHDLI